MNGISKFYPSLGQQLSIPLFEITFYLSITHMRINLRLKLINIVYFVACYKFQKKLKKIDTFKNQAFDSEG